MPAPAAREPVATQALGDGPGNGRAESRGEGRGEGKRRSPWTREAIIEELASWMASGISRDCPST